MGTPPPPARDAPVTPDTRVGRVDRSRDAQVLALGSDAAVSPVDAGIPPSTAPRCAPASAQGTFVYLRVDGNVHGRTVTLAADRVGLKPVVTYPLEEGELAAPSAGPCYVVPAPAGPVAYLAKAAMFGYASQRVPADEAARWAEHVRPEAPIVLTLALAPGEARYVVTDASSGDFGLPQPPAAMSRSARPGYLLALANYIDEVPGAARARVVVDVRTMPGLALEEFRRVALTRPGTNPQWTDLLRERATPSVRLERGVWTTPTMNPARQRELVRDRGTRAVVEPPRVRPLRDAAVVPVGTRPRELTAPRALPRPP